MAKGWLILMTAGLLFNSCKKEIDHPPVIDHPVMQYTDLKDQEIKLWDLKTIDVDGDGKRDFLFEAIPVGDAVLQRTRLQFYAYSVIHSSLLNDVNDNSPALNKGETVKPVHPGYSWWPISAVVVAEKVTPEQGNSFWQGEFKDANPKYLPMKFTRSNLDYYGWIQISIHQPGEKMILHRAAISTEAGKVVKAGF